MTATTDATRAGEILDVKPFTVRAMTRNPCGQTIVSYLPGGRWIVRGEVRVQPSRVTGPDWFTALAISRTHGTPNESDWYVSPYSV